jgi:hypothetical protein
MYCLFCVVLCIVCVYMCTELLPPGGCPNAVKTSYHIKWQGCCDRRPATTSTSLDFTWQKIWDRTQHSYGECRMIWENSEHKEQWPGQTRCSGSSAGSANTRICIIPRTHGVSQTKASKILYHCGFSPLSNSTTPVGRSCKPSTILWMAGNSAGKRKYKYMHNFQNARCTTNKSIESFVPLLFLPFIKEYNPCW